MTTKELSVALDGMIQFEGFPRTKAALGLGAVGVGAGLAGIGAYHIAHRMKKQREWHEKAGPRDVLEIAPELYVDRHGAMYPKGHPGLRGKRTTSLSD